MTEATPRDEPDRSEPAIGYLAPSSRRPGWGAAATAAGLTAVAAEFSRGFWVTGDEAALIWAPAGIALGLGLAYGLRIVPFAVLGLLAWALGRGLPMPAWLLPALALGLSPAAALAALRWLARHGHARGPVRELVAFWLVALTASALLAAPLGALIVPATSDHGETSFLLAWAAYGIADAFGILVLGPPVFRIATALPRADRWRDLAPRPWQLVWVGITAALAGAQLGVAAAGLEGFAAPAVYAHFPLLAVIASMGRPAFHMAVTAVAAIGIVLMTLAGAGGLEAPTSNLELVDVILLVLSFTVMTQLVSAFADEQRRNAENQRDAAHRDFLTGLGNDRALAHRLETLEAGDGLLLLDVEAVRRQFELTGLAGADALERSVARSVARLGPADGRAMRLDRGLFALVTANRDVAELRAVADGICDALGGVHDAEGALDITVRPVCAGVLADHADRSGDELLASARLLLRAARGDRASRVRIERLDDALLAEERSEQALAERLQAALNRDDGFVLFGQRIEPLAAGGGGPWYEMLLRLVEPDGTLRSPGGFLGTAVRSGLMVELDRWVIEHALTLAARAPGTGISINVSGASLSDDGLLDWIGERLAAHHVDPRRVCFELTETESIEHFDRAESFCAAVRRHGARVALDDFGTGLASFEYLRRLAFDALKIDGRFVAAARGSAVDRTMIESTQRVAESLGLETVAEFVEDAWTRDWLIRAGVGHGQGFGIHRPARFGGGERG